MYCIILLLLVKKMLFLCSSDLGEVHHKVKEADHTTTHWKHLAIFHTTPRCCKVRHVCLRYIPVKNQRNSHFCLQNHTRYFKIHLLFFPHSSIKIRISGRFPPPPVPLPAVVGCFELSMAWSAQELGCLPARIPTSTVLPQHEPVWDALYPGNHQRAPQNLLGEQNDSKSFGYQMNDLLTFGGCRSKSSCRLPRVVGDIKGLKVVLVSKHVKMYHWYTIDIPFLLSCAAASASSAISSGTSATWLPDAICHRYLLYKGHTRYDVWLPGKRLCSVQILRFLRVPCSFFF